MWKTGKNAVHERERGMGKQKGGGEVGNEENEEKEELHLFNKKIRFDFVWLQFVLFHPNKWDSSKDTAELTDTFYPSFTFR